VDSGLGENGEAGIRLSDDQAGERDCTAEDAFFVEEIDFGYGLGVAVEVAQGMDCMGYGGLDAEANEVGSHAACGGILVELEQFFDIVALFRLHLFEDGVGPLLGEFGEEIGGSGRVHLFDDVGDSFFIELFEQGFLEFGIDFFEGLGGDFFIEGGEDGFALGGGQVFKDFGEV